MATSTDPVNVPPAGLKTGSAAGVTAATVPLTVYRPMLA